MKKKNRPSKFYFHLML